jgi:hypothetical protein
VDFSLSAESRELTEAVGGFARRELSQDLAKREYNSWGTRPWPQPAPAGRTALTDWAAAAPVARTTSGSISVARPSRVTLIDRHGVALHAFTVRGSAVASGAP